MAGQTSGKKKPMPDKKKQNKKAYALRINGDVLDAVHRWADDELRSVNAQIEFILRDALRREGRIKKPGTPKAITLDDE